MMIEQRFTLIVCQTESKSFHCHWACTQHRGKIQYGGGGNMGRNMMVKLPLKNGLIKIRAPKTKK